MRTTSAPVTFAAPTVTLAAAAAAGSATTATRSDAVLAAFDATAPVTQALADVAAVGVVAFGARRDHVHGMPVGGLSRDSKLTSDQAFTTNTTLAALPGLTYAIAPNETVDLLVDFYVTLGAGQFKMDVTGPAAPSAVLISAFGIDSGANNVQGKTVTAFSTAISLNVLASTDAIVRVRIRVENGANAGTLQVRGAQAASSANTTTFKTPSPIYGWRAA